MAIVLSWTVWNMLYGLSMGVYSYCSLECSCGAHSSGFRLIFSPMANAFVWARIQNALSCHAPLKGKCLISFVMKY